MSRIGRGFVLLAGLLTAGLLSFACSASAGVTPKPGDIIYANATSLAQGATGGIIRVKPKGGRRKTVSDNFTFTGFPQFDVPFWLAIEANGDIVTTGQFVQSDQHTYEGVVRIDPATGVRTAVSLTPSSVGALGRGVGTTFDIPLGIAVESTGALVVVNGNTGDLIRVDPVSGNRTTFSRNSAAVPTAQFQAATDIATAPDGYLRVMDSKGSPLQQNLGAGSLFRVDPVTGAHFGVSANPAPAPQPWFDSPYGLAVDASNLVYVGNRGPARNNIESVSIGGLRTTESDNFVPSNNPKFDEINDITLAQRGKSIISTEYATTIGQVIKTQPNFGPRTLVTDDNKVPGPPATGRPYGVAVYPIAVKRLVIGQTRLIFPAVGDRAAAAATTKGFSYTLASRANVVITIARRTGKRFKSVGTLTQAARAGANKLAFDGRLGKRKLKAGSYRATLNASDAENESVPVSVDFEVR